MKRALKDFLVMTFCCSLEFRILFKFRISNGGRFRIFGAKNLIKKEALFV